ncbi:3-hydroxyacyl-CoA dehydrogenase/enoyl-CoA hydratase family protein [Reichenbachiella agariperforans]|uniref:3-hydroxyacyl-CoA dehydrogenase/enoyl-CoA hydratase family protein n=1 Tax=Reichenbachiella agariperforans TaxID=156994 RepID=UPI001C0A563F|nr:3-hydroxyacyl-CoA dehydrogenase/enoyl-CoA hydratase family protein [Reichenbachiella agariperforans]MBU2914652.1 3-hydroxyacyl-CoA dehydrogenase/enoyl-CoA hydratase family protein [Reichenbachiella agariperforans]
MNRAIKKVAVLGSGIMGSRIACHFANIGVEVLLLDIVPRELDDAEKAKGLTLADTPVRNRIVNQAFESTLKAKPAALYDSTKATLVQLGNFDDDMSKIANYDWIIEVVVENLDIKKQVFETVEKFRKPGTLITSNTSGIPIHLMTDGRSEDFKKHFCGTHFFNPPRYLRLLEIIPTKDTDPEIVKFLMNYGDLFLGKETVLCKDTPAFIANRIGIYAIMSGMHTVEKMGLTVGEVDRMTGPIIGRAKSATFRTMDVVGLDTTVKVATNLYQGLPKDESRDTFQLPCIVQELYDKKWWGDKTKQGYFKKTVDENGKKEILELNLKTMEYGERTKAHYESLSKVKDIENVKERLPILVNAEDKAGEFYRATFYDMFKYCSYRIPEIADELYRIDQAVAAGFAWEIGPFETWDVLGVKETAQKMEAAGMKPADWVGEMIAAGHDRFYKFENGKKLYYDIPTQSYKVVPGTEGFVILEAYKENNIVFQNPGATVYDIGDGILNVEFHTKMNAIGGEVIEGINTAISMAEENFRGVVIGNEAQQFSAGANLAMLFMFASDQEYDEIDLMIRQFQQTMTRARFSDIPVISAPSGLALGGGCELSLHCDAIQAHAETYIGLVEVGVGLIPGGGGTKEFTLRASDQYATGDPELNVLQEYFMNIATAKVATSAAEAAGMHILKDSDRITLNRSRLLADAKARAIEMAEAGYTRPIERQDIKVHGRSSMAMFEAGVTGMLYGNYISEHDAKIAKKLAYVMSGGDLTSSTLVSEQYLLDLEREAFLSLTGEPKTLERIHSILFKGKPLRN